MGSGAEDGVRKNLSLFFLLKRPRFRILHMHTHTHTHTHTHAHAHAHTQPFPYAGQAVFILTLPYRWWFSGMTAKVRGSVVKEISSISNYQMGYNV